MSRNIPCNEDAINNALWLIKALLRHADDEFKCEKLKTAVHVEWETTGNTLLVTGFQDSGRKSKDKCGTRLENLQELLEKAGKPLKPCEIQNIISLLQQLGVLDDKNLTANKKGAYQGKGKYQGYRIFTLALKHQMATHEEILKVVKQTWEKDLKTKSSQRSQKPREYEQLETLNPPANLPRSGNTELIGREDELEKLHELLQQGSRVAICAIRGMGGVGKTELAIQYAKQHLDKKNYAGGVCWLSAQGIDVGTQILRFAEFKFKRVPPEDWELADKLKYCWQNWRSGEALLVFDDVTDYAQQVKPYLPPDLPRFKVLLTTRSSFDSTLKQLPLNVLKPLAAMQLLKSFVKRERLNQEAWIARKICKFLGYLPLALELVGRYLDKLPDLSLEKLLKRLEKKRLKHEAVAANPLMQYEYGVAEVFELTWEHLDQNAKRLGCELSLYALADIPYAVEDIEDDEKQESLEKALAALTDWHLLKRQRKGIYRLHPLIRQFFRMKLEELSEAEEMKITFVAKMVEIAKQIRPQPTKDLIKKVTPLISHVAEATNYLTNNITDESFIWIFTGLGWFYQGQGSYQQAEPWYKQCVSKVESCLGKRNRNYATSLNNLANIYYFQECYEKAEPLYKEALAIRASVLGENDPDYVTSLNYLGNLYNSQKLYEKAKNYYLRAVELTREIQGEKHLDLATYLNNLAKFYYLQKRYEEAEPLYKNAVELTREIQGEEHPNLAISLNNLADLYTAQKRYEEAELLYKEALAIRESVLGKKHPDYVTSLNNLADLYTAQKRYEEAELLYKEALAIRESVLGKKHPDYVTSLNNLAVLYNSQELYEKAEPLYEKALAIRESVLGEEHSKTVKVREKLESLQDKISKS